MSIEQTLKQLRWRYATKTFDSTKKLTKEQLEFVKETLCLTPSSFGLQLWKFLFIQDPKTREKIREKAWKQSQVTDASEIIVFCRPERFTEDAIDKLIQSTAKTRNIPASTLDNYANVLRAFHEGLSEEKAAAWMDRQIYIALGNLMTACAVEGIDTCPLEGFDPPAVDEILNLPSKGLRSVVLCAVGFRSQSDKYANAAKVRYSENDLIYLH